MTDTTHVCPRRQETGVVGDSPFLLANEPDTWHAERGTCSFCGSMNPDELMRRLEAGDIELGPTDKNYKVYVRNKGGEELQAIKFYFQHFNTEQQDRLLELLNARKVQVGYPGLFYVMPFFLCRAA